MFCIYYIYYMCKHVYVYIHIYTICNIHLSITIITIIAPANTSITSHNYQFLFVVRIVKSYSVHLQLSSILIQYSIINYTHHVVP